MIESVRFPSAAAMMPNGRALRRILALITLWTLVCLLFRFMTFYGDRPEGGSGPLMGGGGGSGRPPPMPVPVGQVGGQPPASTAAALIPQAYLSSLLAQIRSQQSNNAVDSNSQPPPPPSLQNTQVPIADGRQAAAYTVEMGQLRSLLHKLNLDYVSRPLAAVGQSLSTSTRSSDPQQQPQHPQNFAQDSRDSNNDVMMADDGDDHHHHGDHAGDLAGTDLDRVQDHERWLSSLMEAEPHVDKFPRVRTDSDLLLKLDNETNLPIVFWNRIKKLQAAQRPAAASKSGGSGGSSTTPAMGPNGQCLTEFPNLFEIEYNNLYWQRFRTRWAANATDYYLYNAYYDDRWRGGPQATVRLLAMIDRVAPPPLSCQLWFDVLASPVVVPASYQYAWYPKWGNFRDGLLQPFIVNCRVPRIRASSLPAAARGQVPHAGKDDEVLLVPAAVSLVERRCDRASNGLKVILRRAPPPAADGSGGGGKRDFAVCVKGLDFLTSDLSVRLVEWLELLRRLGAEKVFLYSLETHPNISKVLRYYQEEGLVELTPITLPGQQPNLRGFRHLYLKNKLTHKRQNELIPYNDCLYRNLYTFRYLLLLDTDEVIMPLAHDNWHGLMEAVERRALAEKNYSRASYNVRNVYFLDDLHEDSGGGSTGGSGQDGEDGGGGVHLTAAEAASQRIPKYLHMMSHVVRARNHTKPGQYVKCFHNTERVVSLHNHFPLNCFGSCTTYSVNTSLAQLQHYRKDCVGPLQKSCNSEFRSHTIRDTAIWRYKEEIIERTGEVLTRLGFFENNNDDDQANHHHHHHHSSNHL